MLSIRYTWFLGIPCTGGKLVFGQLTGNRNFQVARVLCAMLSIRWGTCGFSAFLVRAVNWCLRAVNGQQEFSGCTGSVRDVIDKMGYLWFLGIPCTGGKLVFTGS